MVLVLPVIVEGRVVQVVQQGTAALPAPYMLNLTVSHCWLHSELGHDTSVLFFAGTLLDLKPREELSLYFCGLLYW